LDRPELRVAVNHGGHLEHVARTLLRAADVRALAENSAVRDALAHGEVDAVMTNTFEAPRWAVGLAGVEAIGPLTSDITALWVRADEEPLAERLDTWMLEQEATGRLDALRRRWLGAAGGPVSATPVVAVLAATAERLALMPLVAAAKQRAGVPIEDAAQEDRVLAASASAVAAAAQKRGMPAPSAAAVNAFFRAQIEAAKFVQRTGEPPPSPDWSLEHDLRPAIARISARLAWLLVRIPPDTQLQAVVAQAQDVLAGTGLDVEHVEAIASALAALAR
jgi:cyclohexadienyl dehydratase